MIERACSRNGDERATRAARWALLLVLSLASACGGAAMTSGSADGASGEEAGAAESTTGGDYGGAEGGEMIAEPLGPEEQNTIDGYEDEVTQLVGDLDGAMTLATPNCGRAGDLRDAICDLAERICGIADNNPEHTDVATQCDDGRERCETARQRVGDRCPE
jgi:hypothetical protein